VTTARGDSAVRLEKPVHAAAGREVLAARELLPGEMTLLKRMRRKPVPQPMAHLEWLPKVLVEPLITEQTEGKSYRSWSAWQARFASPCRWADRMPEPD